MEYMLLAHEADAPLHAAAGWLPFVLPIVLLGLFLLFRRNDG
jgi:hypothetical protein